MLNIVLFGPPGAGKGTQSQMLIEKFKLIHLSTGDILRNEIKNKTTLGLQAKELMDNGKLIPDDVVINMIKSILEKISTSSFLCKIKLLLELALVTTSLTSKIMVCFILLLASTC